MEGTCFPLFGKGEIPSLLKSYDWESFPAGHPDQWPVPLITACQLMLDSKQPLCIWWGANFNLIYNDAYKYILGEKHPFALGRPLEEVWTEIFGELEPIFRRVMNGESFFLEHIPFTLSRQGKFRYLFFTVSLLPIRDEAGRVLGIFNSCVETTEQIETEERYRILIEHTAQAVWETDASGRLENDSPSWRAYTGQSLEELKVDGGWLNAVHPDDRTHAKKEWHTALREQTPLNAEFRVRCDGKGWCWTNVQAAPLKNADGTVRKWVGMNVDISERKTAEEETWRHANFDNLTNLPNRRLFRDRLDYEVKRALRFGEPIALLFIDLDRFKEVNDLIGHDAGDVLIATTARRIEKCVRQTDTVARLGGDEFTVILASLHDINTVEQIVQKILDALAEPFHIGKEVVYISGSVGVTLCPNDASSPEEMIRKADQAMYAAKRAGKNQFAYFTEEMDHKAHYRMRLIGELRHAIERNQLSLNYQPVVDLASHRIAKAEALIRWEHPRLGPISPTEFIALAEESGIINEIGNWVFREAASSAKRWSGDLGAPFQIGVNKSPVQFMSPQEDSWIDYLAGLGLPPEYITVEITEGVLLHASENVSDRLLQYRDAGIQVALDDFGTGYSSMAYLKKFDIDFLKIDQSFIRDIVINPQDRAIAESIIIMGHRLGLKVIAEGIETSEQMDILTAAGCDYGQGYFFSPPLSCFDFENAFIKGAFPALPPAALPSALPPTLPLNYPYS